jgi:hypothetical protein
MILGHAHTRSRPYLVPPTMEDPPDDVIISLGFEQFISAVSVTHILPLQLMGRLSCVNSLCRNAFRGVLERYKHKRSKYERWFARALWRRYTYYPLCDPLKRSLHINLINARTNEYGLCITNDYTSPMMLITGFTFFCYSKEKFRFMIANDEGSIAALSFSTCVYEENPAGVTSRDLNSPVRNSTYGAYMSHTDIRHCPFGIPNGAIPWLLISRQNDPLVVCDKEFAINTISHIVVHFEMLRTDEVAKVPHITCSNAEEMRRKINIGCVLRVLYHKYRLMHEGETPPELLEAQIDCLKDSMYALRNK